jgi:hypothetical protein
MRPDASHHPSVEAIEELSDVSPLVVLAPSAHDGIDLLNQLLGFQRSFAPREPTNLLLEVSDRPLPGVRVQRSRLGTTPNLARRQTHRSATSLDFVPEKFETVPDVDYPRLLRIDGYAKRLQDSTCRL